MLPGFRRRYHSARMSTWHSKQLVLSIDDEDLWPYWYQNNICDLMVHDAFTLRVPLMVNPRIPGDAQRIECILRNIWTIESLYSSILRWGHFSRVKTIPTISVTGDNMVVLSDQEVNVQIIYHNYRIKQRQDMNKRLQLFAELLCGL